MCGCSQRHGKLYTLCKSTWFTYNCCIFPIFCERLLWVGKKGFKEYVVATNLKKLHLFCIPLHILSPFFCKFLAAIYWHSDVNPGYSTCERVSYVSYQWPCLLFEHSYYSKNLSPMIRFWNICDKDGVIKLSLQLTNLISNTHFENFLSLLINFKYFFTLAFHF